MPQIKVCHIITRLIRGGAQENTVITVNGLARKGYDVTLIGGPGLGPRQSITSDIDKRVKITIIAEMQRAVNPIKDFIAFWKIYRLCRQKQFTIVHTHSTQAGIYGRLAAKLAGVPIIVHTIHGLAFHRYLNPFTRSIAYLGERIASSYTDKLLCVADVMQEQSLRAGIGPRKKFVTILSGFDVDAFVRAKPNTHFRRQYHILLGNVIVAQVAGLVELKGWDHFFAAAATVLQKNKHVTFLIVGEGELREKIKQQVNDLGIRDNVVFTGLVSAQQMPQLMANIDILVHASLREGLARVLPQALAAAKPCISFDIDGAKEVVVAGKTGILVSPEDAKGLAEAIQRLCTNPSLRKRFGQNGKKLVERQFRAEKMVEGIEDVYAHLMKAKITV